MRLTTHQLGLQMSNGSRPRKTVKFCKPCGGTHAGDCSLVATSHGTRTRPDLLETVERRFRERAGIG